MPSIAAVQPVHLGTGIVAGTHGLADSSVKPRPEAVHHLLDWVVTDQVVLGNPARW